MGSSVQPYRFVREFLACALTLLPAATALAAEHSITGRVTGPDGKGIAQALVFVQSPVAKPPAVPPTATMDQINKTFVPAVLPVVAGTKILFPNSDHIRHHVYSFSRAKTFELPLYKGEDAPPVLFENAGVVKIGCNIHDWMSAIIIVLPNPHYTWTDEDGKFSLPGLEAGTYTLAAWHPQASDKTDKTAQNVELGSNDMQLSFTLVLSPLRPRPAARGARWDQ
jgi:plastocyanin